MRERTDGAPPAEADPAGRDWIEAALGALTVREQEVLRLRFGLGGRMHPVEEVGRHLGVSGGWVRRIERRALSALRANALRGASPPGRARLNPLPPTPALPKKTQTPDLS